MKISISALKNYIGSMVTIEGWLTNKRSSKEIFFLILRDGSGFCQCIVSAEQVPSETFENADQLTIESATRIYGKVVENTRQEEGFEIQVETIEIISIAKDYPIGKKEHGADFLMNNRHLWLRSKRQWAIMRIRNTLMYNIHHFFQKRGFVQMDAPIFTGNACEGTSTLFSTEFYEDKAFLSQSGQLYGEAMALAQGKIYTFGPTFRAEKSKTRRHLSEFWMIEPEMAFYDLEMNMDLIEDFIRTMVLQVVNECREYLDILKRDITKLEKVKKPFVRLDYDEAVKLLKGEQDIGKKNSLSLLEKDLIKYKNKKLELEEEIEKRNAIVNDRNQKKGIRNFNLNRIGQLKNELKNTEEEIKNIPQWIDSARNFTYGNDFGGSDETVLTRLFDVPVMIYDWPSEIKAFYMKRHPQNPSISRGVDLLAPEGYGEIIGGGERETNENFLIQQIKLHNLSMQDFKWYLDLRKFGNVPHSGFGLGLERLLAWICNLSHVRETLPFPRMYGRLFP